MIRELQIRGLYGLYDYDINFSRRSRVKILTGPNGFGKTTILKIIDHLIQRDFWYFCLLYYKQIRVKFDDGAEFFIYKGGSCLIRYLWSHIVCSRMHTKM
jgi:predicted ATP-binding protein involved in virulence